MYNLGLLELTPSNVVKFLLLIHSNPLNKGARKGH